MYPDIPGVVPYLFWFIVLLIIGVWTKIRNFWYFFLYG